VRTGAAARHAQVLGLHHDPDAPRAQLVLQPLCDLLGEALLELQVAGEQVGHPGQLGQTEDPSRRYVADVGET
jgi:hypothetical protein